MSDTQTHKTRGNEMEISKTNSGCVLFGVNQDTGEWFERWYKTEEKAINFANKKGWAIK